jgi:hypothetical protein
MIAINRRDVNPAAERARSPVAQYAENTLAMNRRSMSLYQIRMEGWKALTDALGPAGAMRFMMQYDPGYSDYAEERRTIFADLTIDTLLDAIDRRT